MFLKQTAAAVNARTQELLKRSIARLTLEGLHRQLVLVFQTALLTGLSSTGKAPKRINAGVYDASSCLHV